MNKIISFLFLLLFSFLNLHTATAQAKKQVGKDAYNIQIRVKGIKDTACYLAFYYGDKQYLKDTAKADANGLFIFKGKEALPGGIYLAVLPGSRYFDFVITKEEQSFSLETDTSNYVKYMKIKNSEENKLFYEYLSFVGEKGKRIEELKKDFATAKDKKDSTDIRSKMSEVDKEVKEYKKKIIETHPATFVAKLFKAMTEIEVPEPPKDGNGKIDSLFKFNYYKTHFWDNIDFTDDAILRTPIFHQKLAQYIDDLTYKIPDSINKAADYLATKAKPSKELFKYVVWYITNTHETSKLMGADAVFVHMVDSYYKTKQAYWLDSAKLAKIVERGTILKPLLIGKKAPNLILKDTLGAYKNLQTLNSKFIILFFYDPECGHCKKETPELYKLYQKLKPDGVEVYAVDIERKQDLWKKFIKEHHLDWVNVMDSDYRVNYRNYYDVYSTPVIYILNEKKEIIAKRLAVEQIEDFIHMYQKKK